MFLTFLFFKDEKDLSRTKGSLYLDFDIKSLARKPVYFSFEYRISINIHHLLIYTFNISIIFLYFIIGLSNKIIIVLAL